MCLKSRYIAGRNKLQNPQPTIEEVLLFHVLVIQLDYNFSEGYNQVYLLYHTILHNTTWVCNKHYCSNCSTFVESLVHSNETQLLYSKFMLWGHDLEEGKVLDLKELKIN